MSEIEFSAVSATSLTSSNNSLLDCTFLHVIDYATLLQTRCQCNRPDT